MLCVKCTREIAEGSDYCSFCGARQRPPEDRPGLGARRLARSVSDRKIAGVCGGIAEYFNIDVTIVRLALVILSIVPGLIVFGVIAYLVAWLVLPDAKGASPACPAPAKRLTRSVINRKIAGVCGGLAEFVEVDPTALRLLWVVLSILPGALLGGLLAYVLAWFIIPLPPELEPAPASADRLAHLTEEAPDG